MTFSPQIPLDFSVSEQSTFANFLVSARNSELVSLLRHFAASDHDMVFIWGKTGVGKTHLLQALCKACEDSHMHALYLPIRKIKIFGPDVFGSLHNMDVICMDDIDCIIGEKEWEESLFGFFNRSREAGVKLVVSAGNPPRGLGFTLADLASRMTWDVIYHLHELQDEEKLEALDRRAREKHMPMSPDVLQYIYMRHARDLQSLLEVLEKLDQLSLAEKRRLTIPFVRQVMGWGENSP